jgi:hypothetical protein
MPTQQHKQHLSRNWMIPVLFNQLCKTVLIKNFTAQFILLEIHNVHFISGTVINHKNYQEKRADIFKPALNKH